MADEDFTLNKRLLSFLSNRLGWKNLNAIQRKAIPSVLAHKDTLILAPTASGKTEAALIPIFSEILDKHLKPVSVLYVSPLKALINDMHNRVERWGSYFGLSATKWHGDVERYDKNRFTKDPTDFLLITPESLEVILMNRTSGEKRRVFENVKYILIDEIHYFADSDRGIQLNSLINRIKSYCGDATIIGLSATVGNPELIAQWINIDKPANIIRDHGGRKLQYKVYNLPEYHLSKVLKNYQDKKVLIFSNSRRTAELTYFKLKKDLDMKNIFIHHGSINKQTREENEDRFKEVSTGFMVATTTLELGIDIGDIDIVVQLTSPNNVCSFSQRIGRSGRRSKLQRTIILSQGFNLLVTLAELILHHEGKVEKIKISQKSTDIMFHQILSIVFEKGSVRFNEVYKKLKKCYAFSDIDVQTYKLLINDMCDRKFLEIRNNNLSLGYEFEKEFGNKNYMNFYAVFAPTFEYRIFEGNKEIGTLDVAYAVDLDAGDTFNLAGKLWSVKLIDHEKYTIFVQRVKASHTKMPSWYSEGAPLSYLITGKIYEILEGKFDSKFLKPFSDDATEIIQMTIEMARMDEFREGILPVELKDKGAVYIYTFAGDKANKLLNKIFSIYYDTYAEFSSPVFSSFRVRGGITESDIESVIYDLENILTQKATESLLDQLTESFKKNKFIEHLPEEVRGQLKMDLLFDRDALIDSTIDKSINFIEESAFRKNIFRYSPED